MDVKTKMRYGVTRRKCNQIRKISPKIERNESLRKVSTILRKNESLRSAEEIAVLASMTEAVKEVKFRICRKQKTIERSKEIEDENLILRSKCKKLANALQRAKHLVVYTGAGISTAADIPDYRGPNGIWTLLQQGKQIGKHDLTRADPTMTHMALWQLYRKRYLKFVVSQNCDGLHLRSGLPRRALSEVHGNMYVEMCRDCKPNMQYWRLFDTTERTARFSHKTGRICHRCGASLQDSIVHFGEKGIAPWPLNWAGALHHAAKADVILCLGSSLKVLKKYPWLWAMDKPIKKRPAIYIVNLQWTPKDDVAELKINGKCDAVMKLVMEFLCLETPSYDRLVDPIFAHTSHLSPRELHTTTQPMLVRIPKEANSPLKTETEKESALNLSNENAEKDHCDESKVSKAIEMDEDDDDCPLNVLKIKMNNPSPELQETYSIKSEIIESTTKVKVKSENMEDCIIKSDVVEESIAIVHRDIETKDCVEPFENVCDTYKDTSGVPERTCVKMETMDFSCTVNVEESIDINKSEYPEDLVSCSNLKINAIINNNTNIKSEKSANDDDKKTNSLSTVEGISMEILAEEFERVHVEMKTNENEIHTVSILLVNKAKTPPKKCDKFQQTDPEIISRYSIEYPECKIVKEDLTPDVKLLDTGQDCQVPIKDQVTETQCTQQDNILNLDTKSTSSHIVIDAHCISTQVNKSSVSISSTDIHKQSVISTETNYFNKDKFSNSLRNFRRLKEINRSLFSHHCDTYSVHNQVNESKVAPLFQNHGHLNNGHVTSYPPAAHFEEPLDFSTKQKSAVDSCIRIPTFTPEINSNKAPCILKIPKPPLLHSRNALLKQNSTNLAIDLSFPNEFSESSNYINRRLNMLNRNDKEKYLNNLVEVVKIDEEYAAFKRKCESLARAIIQNTLLVNHNELQHAYSGIHSIIDPVPFNVQYDFKSVFNALNFIHLGQRLMSKGRTTRSTRNTNNGNIKMVSDTITKKRLIYKKRFTSIKRKEPQCTFCHEQYKSLVCNFYSPHNSDDRFEKYVNNKLVMCDCCGDSESSDDSDDDAPLREKTKPEGKSADESATSECNSNVEDGKVLTSNGDLNSGVQISIRDNNTADTKGESPQAGWFGKGFRKNRRRKR